MLVLDYKKGRGKKLLNKFFFCHPLLERRKRMKRREGPEEKKHHHVYSLFGGP